MKILSSKYIVILFTGLIINFLFNCQTTNKTRVENIDFTIIDSGSYGGISISSRELINDVSEYNRLYNELLKNTSPVEYPAYNPAKSYVFITFGQQTRGGLNYTVKKIQNKDNELIVILNTLSEEMNPAFTTAIANPYIVLEINKIQNKKVSVSKE